MELLVVSLVRNIRFEDLADFGGDSMISFICIGLRDRDVVDNDPDERSFCIRTAANVDVVASQLDKIHNDIKRRKTSVGVHGCDVSRQSLFRGIVLEGAGGVIYQPERHFATKDSSVALLGVL